MNPNKELWEKGDFTEIAAFMRQSGEALVTSLRITPPLRALDLGCGDGTTAVPLARSISLLVRCLDSLQKFPDFRFRRSSWPSLLAPTISVTTPITRRVSK